MILKLHYYGHPILRQKASPIEAFNAEIAKLAGDMVETMLSYNNSIGFAGPQLGVALRIFVIREEIFLPNNQFTLGPPEVIINPVLTNPSEETEIMSEGCMSLPGLHVEVARPKKIHVRYQNVKGEFIEEDLRDFRARMFMHENDHLNGVLHIDRMTSAKKRHEIEPLLRAMKKKYSKG